MSTASLTTYMPSWVLSWKMPSKPLSPSAKPCCGSPMWAFSFDRIGSDSWTRSTAHDESQME